MADQVCYDDIVAAVAATDMVVRGGFVVPPDERLVDPHTGHPVGSVVMIGNIGGAMWPRFRAEQPAHPEPLDAWTRIRLAPIAARYGATYVHPSDEPFQPFPRWAQRAEPVWQSPIGLLIHPTYGLWHAYRGAFLFAGNVAGLPSPPDGTSPCVTCGDQPCLSTCPVDAFDRDGYAADRCRDHVASAVAPDCLHDGCAARRACPVGTRFVYGADQMLLHMRAFVGSHLDR